MQCLWDNILGNMLSCSWFRKCRRQRVLSPPSSPYCEINHQVLPKIQNDVLFSNLWIATFHMYLLQPTLNDQLLCILVIFMCHAQISMTDCMFVASTCSAQIHVDRSDYLIVQVLQSSMHQSITERDYRLTVVPYVSVVANSK